MEAKPKARTGSPLYIGAGHGRGGARNKAGRTNDALSTLQVGQLLEAASFAAEAGMPFNRFTTVHWQSAGVANALEATGGFLKRLGDAVKSGGGKFAYLWVRENGIGKGEHVHILWHGPADCPVFGRRQRGWLKAEGARRAKGVCLTRAIGRDVSSAFTGGGDYHGNMREALGYVLKGADEEARLKFQLWRFEPGGLVVGKRCGVSANIGPWARELARASKIDPIR